MEPWKHRSKVSVTIIHNGIAVCLLSLTWRVSSVLALGSSNLVPLRANAPIFCPWAYSSVTSACDGGVTSGRGSGRTVGGATEGRPAMGWREKKDFCLTHEHTHTHRHSHVIFTCRLDSVIWSGSGNLSTVLVHTPAVCGLSVTLDWAVWHYKRFVMKISAELLCFLVWA